MPYWISDNEVWTTSNIGKNSSLHFSFSESSQTKALFCYPINKYIGLLSLGHKNPELWFLFIYSFVSSKYYSFGTNLGGCFSSVRVANNGLGFVLFFFSFIFLYFILSFFFFIWIWTKKTKCEVTCHNHTYITKTWLGGHISVTVMAQLLSHMSHAHAMQ